MADETPTSGRPDPVAAPDIQQELAEERTAMALQRTVLSNERTLNSWLRTGLATVAAGFTLGLLLGQDDVVVPARLFGVMLMLVGGLICVAGLVRYRTLRSRLDEGECAAAAPMWMIDLLVAFFLAISLGGAAILLLA